MTKFKKIILGIVTLASLLLGAPIVHAATPGGITVPQGGTGYTSLDQYGWLSGGGTGAIRLIASTSPTVGYITATSSVASTLPYASTTVISSRQSAYFSTDTTQGTFYPVMIGTSTNPLFTTGTLPPLFVMRKETTTNNIFYPVITIGEQVNSASVISGGGPCYGYYAGSNGTGRVLAMDCVMYDNPVNFIAGAKINLITDINGNFLPYMRVSRLGNVTLGATTTVDISPILARLTTLSAPGSSQDHYHADQGTGLATSTVLTIKSTGALGIVATSSDINSLLAVGSPGVLQSDGKPTVVITRGGASTSRAPLANYMVQILHVTNTGSTNAMLIDTRENAIGRNILDLVSSVGTTTTFESTGRMGVGSSTPWAFLSVTNVGTNPTQCWEDSASPDLTPSCVDANGNWGIGTSSPLTKFAIETGANHSVFFYDAVAGSNGIPTTATGLGSAMTLSRPSDNLKLNSWFILNSNDTGFSSRLDYYWYSNGVEVMRIANSDSSVRANIFTATSTTAASTFPYASTTMITSENASSTKHIAGAGSTGAPSYTFSGDENTGMYNSADGTIRFSGNNSIALTLTGTTITPNQQITNSGITRGILMPATGSALGTPVYSINGDSDTGMGSASADILDFIAGGVNKMQIDTNGASTTGRFLSTTATSTFNAVRITNQYTPPTSAMTCTIGDMITDASFIYVCTASNTWKRATLSAF